MFDKIPAGRHSAKVIDYGLGETKNGDPQVKIRFKLDGDGSEITWFGSLKEGRAREITIDALLVCGMVGDDLNDLSGGAGSGILNEKKSVSIVVEDEEYNGKTTTKVKWINDIDGGGRSLAPDKKPLLKSMKGDILARRAQRGKVDSKDNEELPF